MPKRPWGKRSMQSAAWATPVLSATTSSAMARPQARRDRHAISALGHRRVISLSEKLCPGTFTLQIKNVSSTALGASSAPLAKRGCVCARTSAQQGARATKKKVAGSGRGRGGRGADPHKTPRAQVVKGHIGGQALVVDAVVAYFHRPRD